MVKSVLIILFGLWGAFVMAKDSVADEQEKDLMVDFEATPKIIPLENNNYRKIFPITKEWYKYEFDWKDISAPIWDFSQFFHEPAGKFGFVQSVNGHFTLASTGKRIRFWGANLTGAACFPPHEESKIIAKLLKKWGFNAVRFAQVDARWAKGIVDYSNREAFNHDILAFDEEKLDRLFYFMSELKKNGIYFMMDAKFSLVFSGKKFHWLKRYFKSHRGVRDCWLIYFSNDMQEYIKKYNSKLFLSKNPYTGLSLKDEPAMLAVQMMNETFISRATEQIKKLEDLPSELHPAILKQWSIFLNDIKKENFTEFDKANQALHREFFIWSERRYFQKMKNFYQETIGLKCPIGSTSCYSSTCSWQSAIDGSFTQGHVYYSHYRNVNVKISDKEVLKLNWVAYYPAYMKHQYTGFLGFIVQQKIGWQPYIVGEWNICHPLPERFDAALWMSVIGQIQDWDGMFIYTLLQCPWENYSSRSIDYITSIGDPSRMSNMIPAAWAWHAKLIPTAEKTYRVTIPQEFLYENPNKIKDAFIKGMFLFKLINTPPVPGIKLPPGNVLTVDLLLKNKKYLPADIEVAQRKSPIKTFDDHIIVNSEYFESIYGNLGGKRLRSGILEVTAPEGEAFSVTILPLDGKSLKESGKILMTLGPVSLAEGQGFLEKIDVTGKLLARWALSRKRNNAYIKPMQGMIKIRHDGPMKCMSINSGGIRKDMKKIDFIDETLIINISSEDHALWYILEKDD